MEKTELKQDRDNKLTLSTMGLNLEVQPYWLIKEMMNDNSQKMLDSMIEAKYRWLILEYRAWKKQDYNSLVDYKYTVHVDIIQDGADIFRNLLPLHSDYESIFLTEDDLDTLSEISSYWKYNTFYGYEPTK